MNVAAKDTFPKEHDSQAPTERSDSSVASAPGSPRSQVERGKPKLGVLYWGAGPGGWDVSGRIAGGGGFPRICRTCDSLVDSWRGRMENVQVTLRICASEGPGFKRYIKHFLALSDKACMEFRLRQYHQFNRARKKKVLTERLVIGGILEAIMGQTRPDSGLRVSTGCQDQANWSTYIRRRARRYRWQAHREGGYFAALLLEGGLRELQMRDLVAAADQRCSEKQNSIKRLLIILGGPEGISPEVRARVLSIIEAYTDFPTICLTLPGGLLHSYYALANLFVFHDQGLLFPYLHERAGQPRAPQKEPTTSPGLAAQPIVTATAPDHDLSTQVPAPPAAPPELPAPRASLEVLPGTPATMPGWSVTSMIAGPSAGEASAGPKREPKQPSTPPPPSLLPRPPKAPPPQHLLKNKDHIVHAGAPSAGTSDSHQLLHVAAGATQSLTGESGQEHVPRIVLPPSFEQDVGAAMLGNSCQGQGYAPAQILPPPSSQMCALVPSPPARGSVELDVPQRPATEVPMVIPGGCGEETLLTASKIQSKVSLPPPPPVPDAHPQMMVAPDSASVASLGAAGTGQREPDAGSGGVVAAHMKEAVLAPMQPKMPPPAHLVRPQQATVVPSQPVLTPVALCASNPAMAETLQTQPRISSGGASAPPSETTAGVESIIAAKQEQTAPAEFGMCNSVAALAPAGVSPSTASLSQGDEAARC